jgi:hypothetical protein
MPSHFLSSYPEAIFIVLSYYIETILSTSFFCLRRPGGAIFEKTAPPGPPRKNFLLFIIKSFCLLEKRNIEIVSPYENSDWLVINTCGFIRDAKEESIDEILAALEKKVEKFRLSRMSLR